MQLAQYRGGARFCTRVGLLNFSFHYKVFGVSKNRDTKREPLVSAGAACAAITNLSGDHEVFAAQKAVAYTDLLAAVALLLVVEEFDKSVVFPVIRPRITFFNEINRYSIKWD